MAKKYNSSDVDVITCWPKSLDYPTWRDFIKNHAHYFNKIFICFTETHKPEDYSDFVEKDLAGPQFVFLRPQTPGNEDWRNYATNQALDISTANWVWFTEQDFLVTNPAFWPIVRLRLQEYDVLGFREGNRLHPANMWVKRSFINKTRRDFGIVPDQMDHFGKFYFDLRHNEARVYSFKYEGGNGPRDMFYHLNGLSHNLSLIQNGQQPVYREDEFASYISLSLEVKPQNAQFEAMCQNYLKEYASYANKD